MDALALLKADHQKVEGLFKRLEKEGSPRATKQRVMEQVIAALSVHAAIEEELFYPALRRRLEDEEPQVLEALEEHHVAKWLLKELDGMDAAHERFPAKCAVLMRLVRTHIREEEQILFPAIRKAMTPAERRQLGDLLERAKKVAPTHPHPRASDTPPGNMLEGAIAGLLDRGLDGLKAALMRGRRTEVIEEEEEERPLH